MPFSGAFRKIARGGYPILTPVLRDVYRTKGIVKYGFRPLLQSLRWYFRSKEYTNFTYDISDKCKKYLVDFIANTFGITHDEVVSYLREVEEDSELADHFLKQVPQTADRYFADLPIRYGRRIGWYAILRILKPRIVVESGVDRGVGTCVLAAAMLRNAKEGYGGKVIGLDINPFAGSYVAGSYSSIVEIVHGDSLAFLLTTDQSVDVFIHDSNHSAEHETQEFEQVWPKLSKNGVIISDNSNVTDCLYEFARKNSLYFCYWQEEVVNHVASPGSIALALHR